jgi:hypothetical protein
MDCNASCSPHLILAPRVESVLGKRDSVLSEAASCKPCETITVRTCRWCTIEDFTGPPGGRIVWVGGETTVPDSVLRRRPLVPDPLGFRWLIAPPSVYVLAELTPYNDSCWPDWVDSGTSCARLSK